MQTAHISEASPSEQEQLHALQKELERLFSKNQLIPRIKKEFIESDVPFAQVMEAAGIPLTFGFDVLAQIFLHKRADVKTMVGVLYRHLNDGQATADMLMKCVEADLLDYNPNLGQFIVIFEVTADVQEELNRYQFPLPMVVPPKPVTSNNDTGYILGSGSLILNQAPGDDDICLDHINRMNAIRFALDLDTAAMVQNSWSDLDKQREGETKKDFEKRQRAFAKYDQAARHVMAQLTSITNVHHVTHRYDKRGRTYCMGYHVNYQGTEWNKSVVCLADKEMVE